MSAPIANILGSGVIIPSPGVDKAVGILGVYTTAPIELRENEATGNLIAYIPQGATDLTACINAGMGSEEGNAVYCKTTFFDTACSIVWTELQNYPLQIFGCPYTNPTTPDGVPALSAALCDEDCTDISWGDPIFSRFLTKKEADEAAFGSMGLCGAVDCSDLAPTEFCHTLWCYNNPPRSAAGFMPILWGYTMCFGPAGSSSSVARQAHRPVARQAHRPVARQAHRPVARQAHRPVARQAHRPVARQAHRPVARQAHRQVARPVALRRCIILGNEYRFQIHRAPRAR